MNKKLLAWFKKNKRNLPWREHRSWYRIWISEIMLQQTQVSQVIPYFRRFIQRFPNVHKLAAAGEQEILKLWEGLGYYSRARNLHRAARQIVTLYQGRLPDTREKLSALPGFGPYTTNAVLSLAFNRPHAVVDGNVMRCLTRLYAIPDDVRLPATVRHIQDLAGSLLDQQRPAAFNEALMELGATVCLPQNPDCGSCPLRTECKAFRSGTIKYFPYKSPAAVKPQVNVTALIIVHRNRLVVARRTGNGLLGGLWEFPCYTEHRRNGKASHESADLPKRIGLPRMPEKLLGQVKHSYTHFNLELTAALYHVEKLDFRSEFYAEHRLLSPPQIEDLPTHRAMGKLLALLREDLKVITK